MRPPPASTLFPYTTLFRSDGGRAAFGGTYVSQLAVLLPRVLRGDFADLAEEFAQSRLGSAWQPGFGFSFSPWADRKSTRLNSSHLGISYAVFCLKKKKTNT